MNFTSYYSVDEDAFFELTLDLDVQSGVEKIDLVSDADISWLNVDIGLLRSMAPQQTMTLERRSLMLWCLILTDQRF